MEEKVNASMANENENSNAVNSELEGLREDNANLLAELVNLKEKVKSLESKLMEAESSNSSLNKWWLQERSKAQVLCIVAKAAAGNDESVAQLIDRIAKAI